MNPRQTNSHVACLSITILSTVILLSGCGVRSAVTKWAMQPILDGAIKSLMAEFDPELAKTGLEAELKLLEGMLEVYPEDRNLLTLAAHGFTGYALLYLSDTSEERASEVFLRALQYGRRGLALNNPAFAKSNLPWKEFERLIGGLKREDIPLVYWTATAWAQWIDLNRTKPAALALSPRPLALMNWLMDIDSHYYYSGPLWFMGAYYASLPPLLGGDPARAKNFFERAIASDGGHFLYGKLLYAKTYAVNTLDEELFDRLISEILAGVKDEPPELRLLNRITVQKARKLRAHKSDLF